MDLNLLYFGLQYQYQSHLKIIYPHYEFRNLSALNFICSADSSPETYKTCPSPFTLSHNCNIKVDLPIPGSPPSKINEPFTSPPPKTLSNSSKPVDVLIVSLASYESSLCGILFVFFSAFNELFLLSTIFCSKKVFQLPHAGHFPSHFPDSYPHSLHTKTVLFFATFYLLFVSMSKRDGSFGHFLTFFLLFFY